MSEPVSELMRNRLFHFVTNGYCIRLAYSEFPGLATDSNDRTHALPSCETDSERLKKALEEFAFEFAEPCGDKTTNGTEKYLEKELAKIKSRKAHQTLPSYDCLIVHISSHGFDGKFLCDDGYLSTDVIRELCADKELAGVPKLVFIDTCQVTEKIAKENEGVHETATRKRHAQQPDKIPKDADLLWARATTTGHFALESAKAGWFTGPLCAEIPKLDQLDVVSALTRVLNQVAQKTDRYSPSKGPKIEIQVKQMPVFESTLRYYLYFTRKIVNPMNLEQFNITPGTALRVLCAASEQHNEKVEKAAIDFINGSEAVKSSNLYADFSKRDLLEKLWRNAPITSV